MSGGGFGLIIWAMSITPMTYVSALRETSVIAAALIGTLVLKESLGARRLAAASMVGAGVLLLQLTRSG
jgi:drug/metabolite transporter (DMT)-like permease